jgi:DNA-binding transcriptional MerR regulator
MKKQSKRGWSKSDTEQLFKQIRELKDKGYSLKNIFLSYAAEHKRQPDSVRNFYYSYLDASQINPDDFKKAEFLRFSNEEVVGVVRHILISRAEGKSVRFILRELCGGDRQKMLRYQNKYRSTVKKKPALVTGIMNALSKEGLNYINPYEIKYKKTPDNTNGDIAKLRLYCARIERLLDNIKRII